MNTPRNNPRPGARDADRPGAQTPARALAPAKILVADADPIVADALADHLALSGHGASTALTADEALGLLSACEESGFAVVFVDISLPAKAGVSLLRAIAAQQPAAAVIATAGYSTVESAVESLRAGACDYVTKPFVDGEIALALERALRHHAILRENTTLRSRLDTKLQLGGIAGSDAKMLRVMETVRVVAASKTTVLMTGESGTGKSLIAHAIHHHSPRKDKPFIEISCGSIPETLLESELFGHAKGAFTGAHADKQGRFLAAHHGTIFLDEINSASPGMQLKLLRVLQERKFEPVGSAHTVEVDVRVILATNQNLESLVASGQFRQDLYYRVNVVNILLPPLRDRAIDIGPLAEHFLRKHAAELGRELIGFTPEALHALQRYAFPGNVRELQNIIERASVLARGAMVTLEDLPEHIALGTDHGTPTPAHTSSPFRIAGNTHAPSQTPTTLEEALKEPERRILLAALEAHAWNRQKTSEQLGINRTTLYKKLKALGIEDDHEPRSQAG